MWWRGATCDTFVQWQVMLRGNIMWCRGTITADAVCGALGQWHVVPWGNPGSWHRGVMPGYSPVGWFFRNPNLWFGAQSAKWLKQTFTWKKSKLGKSRTLCLALARGSSLQIRFCAISLFEGNWSKFFLSQIFRNDLGNDKKIIEIGKLLIIIWFLFFKTLLEIDSLMLSSFRLVCRCVKQYIN